MNKSGRVGTYRTMPDWASLAFSTTYGAAAGVMDYVAEGADQEQRQLLTIFSQFAL